MTDKKISQLTLATLTGSELIEVVQGSANLKATAQAIANLAPASPGGGGAVSLLAMDFATTPVLPLNVAASLLLKSYTLPGNTLGVNDALTLESTFYLDIGSGGFATPFTLALQFNGNTVGFMTLPYPNVQLNDGNTKAMFKLILELQNLGSKTAQHLSCRLEQIIIPGSGTYDGFNAVTTFANDGGHVSGHQLAFIQALNTASDVTISWVATTDGSGAANATVSHRLSRAQKRAGA